jgi:cell division septum initiation protein DivIVA
MSEFDAEQPEDTPAHGSAGVGARVTSILEAAEQAAEQIRSDALREAAETMKRAEADAEARIQELTREADRVRAEADDYARDIRQAVDSYGTQARREAEEEARALMQSAEDQSRSIRENAEAMAGLGFADDVLAGILAGHARIVYRLAAGAAATAARAVR